MKVELHTEMESEIIDIKDKNFCDFVKRHLDAGRDFDIFFPDYEITTEEENEKNMRNTKEDIMIKVDELFNTAKDRYIENSNQNDILDMLDEEERKEYEELIKQQDTYP